MEFTGWEEKPQGLLLLPSPCSHWTCNLYASSMDLVLYPIPQPVLEGGTAGLGSGDGGKDRAQHSISATAIALLHDDPVSDLTTKHSPFLPLCFRWEQRAAPHIHFSQTKNPSFCSADCFDGISVLTFNQKFQVDKQWRATRL